MSNMPAEPIVIDSGATLRRPGRVLLGWLNDDRGALALAGGDANKAGSPELIARVRTARDVVASRPPFQAAGDATTFDEPGLAEIEARLRSQEEAKSFFDEGWSVGLVDLTRVCSLQQQVSSQESVERVKGVSAKDLHALAELTLPARSLTTLPVQFDQIRNSWIVSAANPNLRIVGGFNAPIGEGVIGLGFGVSVMSSFLQVARHHGRLVLRDGYQRAYGLLERGISYVPAFVRDFGVGDLGTAQGLFTTDVYLAERPPLLSDFLDDSVSSDVELPIVQKMIVIQGLELTPLV